MNSFDLDQKGIAIFDRAWSEFSICDDQRSVDLIVSDEFAIYTPILKLRTDQLQYIKNSLQIGVFFFGDSLQ